MFLAPLVPHGKSPWSWLISRGCYFIKIHIFMYSMKSSTPFFSPQKINLGFQNVFANFQNFFFNQILVVSLFLLRGSQDYPQVWWLARRTHRTQHRVTLTAMIYCSKRIQSKISKGKRQMRWSRGNQVQTSFSQWSHTGQTYSSRDKLWREKCPLGKFITGLVPQIFIRGWSHMHSLPSTYQNSRVPKGKQVFSINHIVCSNSLDSEAFLSYNESFL